MRRNPIMESVETGGLNVNELGGQAMRRNHMIENKIYRTCNGFVLGPFVQTF